jgi:hypothetical protein
MARFLDTYNTGPITTEQLKELQKSPPDEFGVRHINMLYNYEANIMTRQALANIRDSYNVYLKIEKENEEHHAENERRRQERLRKIKEENKNLEWPKPDRPFKVRKSSDYWKNRCLYCSYYKPQTTHDYEVHIVTKHPGKPAYPGPADVEFMD